MQEIEREREIGKDEEILRKTQAGKTERERERERERDRESERERAREREREDVACMVSGSVV